jgi:hypothetical protein
MMRWLGILTLLVVPLMLISVSGCGSGGGGAVTPKIKDAAPSGLEPATPGGPGGAKGGAGQSKSST